MQPTRGRGLPAYCFAVVGFLLAFPAVVRSGVPAELYDELVLREFELRFEENDWEELLEEYYFEKSATGTERYVRADLTVDGVTYPDVGVQYRGYSSFLATAGTRKRPFKITLDAFVEGQHIFGRDTIALNNSFLDASRTAEVLAYHIAREYVVAPRANWVRLLAGTNEELDDLGVYVNVERIERSFLQRSFGNDGGHRYRAVLSGTESARFEWRGSERAAYEPFYPLKGGDGATAYRDLIEMLSILHDSSDEDLVAALDPVLDVDGALRVLALNAAVSNFDSFLTGQNYYLYGDAVNGRLSVIPWDMDASFRLNPLFSPYQLWNDHALTERILSIPELRARYVAHLREIATEALDWDRLEPIVSTWQALLEDEVSTSPHELFSHGEFLSAFERLRLTVLSQRESILSYDGFDAPTAQVSEVTHAPLAPSSLDELRVSARFEVPEGAELREAVLRYRRAGAFREAPLLDDGEHGDETAGDGVFSAVIPPQTPGGRLDYYIEVWTIDGAVSFSPATAGFRSHGVEVSYVATGEAPFLVNELVASNERGAEDESGQREDWLEIINDSRGTWSTGGYFLTDDPRVPTLWKLPDILIPPGGFLRVWCDGETEQGFLHAPFKLSSAGETIYLITPEDDGYRLADAIVFAEQRTDVSWGRACDGGEVFRFFLEPTPGASNGDDCRPAGLVVPGDCEPDGDVNITDAVCLLSFLFLGSEPRAACDDVGELDAGIRALLDINGDLNLNLSDGVALLNFLFLQASPPVQGRDCAAVPYCESACLE